ncbi:hypothetical protein EVAR_73253_1 [Eumeta japonica]|uniref:Uncharacterized protein n=1 Tax=Eumeta variegata TaxID=151549 RepID=A0A4C1T517_EUMVA|nr:hypothetical protein EVAR_73253_1 [Eumeta japonica]
MDDSYSAEVKSEEDNLFEEKDRILEHLLNENDYNSQASEKDRLTLSEVNEDDLKNCYVLLEDVTSCFPVLKESSTVKVPRNAASFFSKSDKIKKFIKKRGKYRPRRSKKTKDEPDSDDDSKSGKSYRLASISAKQLKERLKLYEKAR